MNPTDIISVRLFKQCVSERIPSYLKEEDEKVYKTLNLILSSTVYDSALLLKNELKNNQLDFQVVIEEYLSDLVDYIIETKDESDPIVQQLINTDYFSFLTKLNEVKEVQIAIQRSERRQIKAQLKEYDERQEEEELQAVFQRIERKELKGKLNELNYTEIKRYSKSMSENYQTDSNSRKIGMWLRVASILLVILIPSGIILYRNYTDVSTRNVAESTNNPNDVEPEYVASEDISDLIQIDLPEDLINNIEIPVLRSESSMGYAQESDKIRVHLISNKQKGIYLKEKIEKLESKKRLMTDTYEKNLKSGNIKAKGPESIEYQRTKEQLDITVKECESLLTSIRKKENTYLFDNQSIDLFSSSLSKKDSFKVYERKNNEEDVSVEYYLLIKGNYYKIKKGVSGQLIKVTNQEIIDELNDY